MVTKLFSIVLAAGILLVNVNFNSFTSSQYTSPLVCVNSYIKFFSFGQNSQVADFFWMRFLQELDAYNQLSIAKPHLCPDNTSSWHFHIMNAAVDLDSKFYELAVYAPLLISITIGDSKGASVLFDKAVANFPNDWRVLYRASYQAQIEERNKKKAADLLYRAGKNGAPSWVMSLAGGLYNATGERKMAEQIYTELLKDSKDEHVAKRLKEKLDNKLKNYFDETELQRQEAETK